MVKICPISTKQVNENISRLNSVFTVLFTLAFIVSGSVFFLIAIVVDFSLRNLYEGKFNPIIKLNMLIANTVSLRVHLINAGPKIFAARVGLILSSASLLLAILSFSGAALIPILILGLFSFLEGAFGYCVACKLYPYLKAMSL